MVLGAVLRLLYLGSIPSGFFRDEAAIGYNAYSIWATGADEFGMKFPLVFRSFEVFFLPLYIYLSAPLVGLLGLTESSVRFLSSLSGILAIYFAYLIAKEIWTEKAGLWSSFIVAIAPWHIFYSRGAFEGNLALTLFGAGFYFWLKFLKKYNVWDFLLSGICLIASMYSYQAERVVVPLFALAAGLMVTKKLWSIRLKLILPLVVLTVVLIPLLSLSFKAGGYHRAFGVSVFSKDESPPGWIAGEDPGLFINNKFFLRFRQISSLYLSYFSPRNLFIEGDSNRQRSVENFSVFYAFMIVGAAWGIWSVAKKPSGKERLLLFWTMLAPLPAALTGDPFHTYRSLLVYMPLSILTAYGFSKIKRNLFFVPVGFVALAVFIFNYAFLTQTKRAHDWDFGYREIVSFTRSLPSGTRVVVDDSWTESYIHFLFFGKVDPKLYQKEVSKLGNPVNYYYTSSEEIRPSKLGDFEFRKVDWAKERGDTGTVFIIWSQTLPESEFRSDPKVKLLKEITYPDGTAAFRIVQII